MKLELIKKMRAETGLSLDLCKKALEKSDFDYDNAVLELRKSGALRASKLETNSAEEGQYFLSLSKNRKSIVLVELFCQTDFAARSEDFQNFGQMFSSRILEGNSSSESFSDLSAKLGEKVSCLQHLNTKTTNIFCAYRHSNGKVIAIVELKADVYSPEVIEFGENLAMQLAGMTNIRFFSRSEISLEEMEKQKEICTEQLKNKGKKVPTEKLPQILNGQINSWLSEICFLDSKSLLTPEKTIAQTCQEAAARLAQKIEIVSINRWSR